MNSVLHRAALLTCFGVIGLLSSVLSATAAAYAPCGSLRDGLASQQHRGGTQAEAMVSDAKALIGTYNPLTIYHPPVIGSSSVWVMLANTGYPQNAAYAQIGYVKTQNPKDLYNAVVFVQIADTTGRADHQWFSVIYMPSSYVYQVSTDRVVPGTTWSFDFAGSNVWKYYPEDGFNFAPNSIQMMGEVFYDYDFRYPNNSGDQLVGDRGEHTSVSWAQWTDLTHMWRGTNLTYNDADPHRARDMLTAVSPSWFEIWDDRCPQ